MTVPVRWYPSPTRRVRKRKKGYYYARNALGDIIAVYRSEDSKLVGTYEYDLWGRLISATEGEEGVDTDDILTKNPFRYRSYYYDNETGFYNLNARYYDPEIRRFISADSMSVLMVATVSLECKNLFAYSISVKQQDCKKVNLQFDLIIKKRITLKSNFQDFWIILFILYSYGSHVRCMPNFLNVLMSTLDNGTVECTSHPFKKESCSNAFFATSLVAALAESAINISSV